MGILIQDSFTDADGIPLGNHTSEIGGNWLDGAGGYILGNKAANSFNEHSTEAPSYNCYAQAILSWIAESYDFYLVINSSFAVGYLDVLRVQKNVLTNKVFLNGAELVGVVPANGALWKIERVGPIVYAYKDGVLIGTGVSAGTEHKFIIHGLGMDPETTFVDDYEAGGEISVPYVDHFMLLGVH